MRDEPVGRHMKHGLDFFVEEIGQFSILFTFRNLPRKGFAYPRRVLAFRNGIEPLGRIEQPAHRALTHCFSFQFSCAPLRPVFSSFLLLRFPLRPPCQILSFLSPPRCLPQFRVVFQLLPALLGIVLHRPLYCLPPA